MTYAVGGAGVVAMVVASLLAPAQPELSQGGGACQIAPCGTLEDPEHWCAVWWLWGVGLVALLFAAASSSRPRPRRYVVLLVTAPLWLLGVAFLAYVASLLTSVPGAATVVACVVLGPLVSLLAGALKASRVGGSSTVVRCT